MKSTRLCSGGLFPRAALPVFAAVALLTLGTRSAQSIPIQTFTFNNANSSNILTDSKNYTNNSAPYSGSNLTFTALAGGTSSITNDLTSSSFSLGTITFDSTAPAYVIGGTTPATANSGNAFILSGYMYNDSANLQTINDPFSITQVQTLATTPGNILLGGVISGTGGGITKTGTGTLILTNNSNSYTGGTTISQGNLELLSSTGTATSSTSDTGAGTVTLNGGSGAALTGTGISAGTLAVTNSSVIAPGVNTAGTNYGAVGTLTVGQTGGMSLTNAVLDYDLGGNATSASDQIVTNGTLALGTTTKAITFNFNELGNVLETGGAYTLISGATTVTGFNPANTSNIGFNFLSSGGTAPGTSYTPTFHSNGTNLTVTFAIAPEPGQTGTLSLIGLGMFGLFLRARKRRRNAEGTAA